MRSYRVWTEAEDTYLSNHYKSTDIPSMAKYLKRTEYAVQYRIRVQIKKQAKPLLLNGLKMKSCI